MSEWLKYAGGTPVTIQRGGHRGVWYKIDTANINRPIQWSEHTYLGFSPYDVPEAVAGELDEQTGIAGIVFKYINDEPINRVDMNDFIVYLGKHSHRLHKVEVQAKTVRQYGIVSTLSQAIDRLKHDRPRLSPPDHYDIAKGIVRDIGEKLLEPAA
jgi:hypothetical protein